METSERITIDCISNDGRGASEFCTKAVTLSGDEYRRLSDQLAAVNFRLRSSGAQYQSGVHVAGDPTLLIILHGEIEISLQSGSTKRFAKGDMFIAEDYLDQDVEFDEKLHGHKARVIGDDGLRALHLKLGRR